MIGHVHRPERVAGMASRQLIARAARSSDALPANGKNVVITGANTGIGIETAKNLSKQGYNLTLVCRDEKKAEAAKQLIIDAGTAAEVRTEQMDLADLSTVRECTSRMLDQGRQIDVLINNAGVMACPEMQTKDGFEYQLGVNHLGHFEFTNRLLPLLAGRSSRIVNVSSSAHTFGTINFQNINLRGEYKPWPAYGQSKLANVLFTYEMARRLPPASRITVNALHPGVVKTELSRYLLPENPSWWQKLGIELLSKAPWLLEPEQGAATSIYLASSPEVEAMSSKYWVDSKTSASSAESYDVDVARRLWELSQEMTGCEIDVAAVAPCDSVTSSTS